MKQNGSDRFMLWFRLLVGLTAAGSEEFSESLIEPVLRIFATQGGHSSYGIDPICG